MSLAIAWPLTTKFRKVFLKMSFFHRVLPLIGLSVLAFGCDGSGSGSVGDAVTSLVGSEATNAKLALASSLDRLKFGGVDLDVDYEGVSFTGIETTKMRDLRNEEEATGMKDNDALALEKEKMKRDHQRILIADYEIEDQKSDDTSHEFRVFITYNNTQLDKEYPRRVVFWVFKSLDDGGRTGEFTWTVTHLND